jgi:hypothetical protein
MYTIYVKIFIRVLKPQSTYGGHRGKVEIGGVYLPSQLKRIHQNLVRDGRYSEREWVCTVHPPPSPGWANFSMYARKWPLTLFVLYGVEQQEQHDYCFFLNFITKKFFERYTFYGSR